MTASSPIPADEADGRAARHAPELDAERVRPDARRLPGHVAGRRRSRCGRHARQPGPGRQHLRSGPPGARPDLFLANRRGQRRPGLQRHAGRCLVLHRRALLLSDRGRHGHGFQLQPRTWDRRRPSMARASTRATSTRWRPSRCGSAPKAPPSPRGFSSRSTGCTSSTRCSCGTPTRRSRASSASGAKDVKVEYSADGETWTALGDFEFAQATGFADYTANTTVDFGGVAVKFVKLTINSNFGGLLAQYGLSEVRFYSVPVVAREPQPAAGATGVDPQVQFSLASRPRSRFAQGLRQRQSAGSRRRHRGRRDGLCPAVRDFADARQDLLLEGRRGQQRRSRSARGKARSGASRRATSSRSMISRPTRTPRATESMSPGSTATKTPPTARSSATARRPSPSRRFFTAAGNRCRCSTRTPAAPRSPRPS